jgi:hypothetical protein
MNLTRTITGETPTVVTLTSLVRKDTGAAVPTSPALPQAFAAAGGGVYTFAFTEPAAGLTYAFAYTITWADGSVDSLAATQVASDTAVASGYFDAVASADAIAATLPSALVASYLAATAADKASALEQASLDIDDGMRFQGRKYDPTQLQEFPRIAYESNARVRPQGIVPYVLPPSPTDTVWDWNATTQTPVVPPRVLQAVIYQADWILNGTGEERASEQHAGVTSQQVAGAMEAYDLKHRGADSSLGRRAWNLLRKYELRTGRMV